MYNKAKSLLIDIFYLRKEDKMTVEELEVVVNASIEPAMKEIKKLMPQFKKEVEKVAQATQKTIEQIDMKNMTKQVQQAVQVIKQKMDTLKQSSKNSEITLNINNKEAEKQISQIEKQIISLQDKINARQMKLDMINPQIEEIMNNTKKEVIPGKMSQNENLELLNDLPFGNVLNNLVNIDWNSLSSQVEQEISKLYEVFNSINWSKIAKNLILGINSLTSSIDWNLLGVIIGDGINSSIDFIYAAVTNFNWLDIAVFLGNCINNLFHSIDWANLGSTISEALGRIIYITYWIISRYRLVSNRCFDRRICN